MSDVVSFAPEAEAQLIALFRYIAGEASNDIADRYVGSIIEQCEKLDSFPLRGTPRDDIRPGLRTIAFRRRVTIAIRSSTRTSPSWAFIMVGRISRRC